MLWARANSVSGSRHKLALRTATLYPEPFCNLANLRAELAQEFSVTERVLITGGAGFIGRHIAKRLCSLGYDVRILDSLIDQVHGSNGPVAKVSREVELIVGDVRDEEALSRALRGVDSVIHLAAEVGVGQSMYAIERYVSCNDLGTAALFQRLIDEPVRRVVVASSMSVYGEGLYRDENGMVVENATRRNAGGPNWDPVDAR